MEDHPLDASTAPARTTGLPHRTMATHEAQDEVAPRAVGRARAGRAERALEKARQCARIADDNRARDIVLLDLRQATPLVDYFVIATAASRRQANAIAIEIDVTMKRETEVKLGVEGAEEGRWILMDYGDFVVHLFNPDTRAYYALEDVWGDAPRLEWRDSDHPQPKVPHPDVVPDSPDTV